MLPSEKTEYKAQQKKLTEQAKEQEKRLKQAFNRLFSCDDGVVFLRWLGNNTGYHESGIVVKELEVNQLSTIHNVMRRSVYVKIRSMLGNELLKQVDYGSEAKREAPNE